MPFSCHLLSNRPLMIETPIVSTVSSGSEEVSRKTIPIVMMVYCDWQ